MKRLVGFFMGLLLLAGACLILYLGGVIYDLSSRVKIVPVVMQPGNFSADRLQAGAVPIQNLSDEFIQERLVKKFMHEYFYVIPDTDNLKERARNNSVLAIMTTPEIFEEWKKVILPELERYAEQNQMQRVRVHTPFEKSGDYLEIKYDLIYNDHPNKMDTEPKIESNKIYIIFDYEKGIRENMGGRKFDAGRFLEKGFDPAMIFKFRINKVAI